ncbi:hypothetical protein C7U60_10470 [Mesorhizobium plurifarium]|nr:hypothetical protein C7U60_10470 [Mesorhizobium plurifarium]
MLGFCLPDLYSLNIAVGPGVALLDRLRGCHSVTAQWTVNARICIALTSPYMGLHTATVANRPMQ